VSRLGLLGIGVAGYDDVVAWEEEITEKKGKKQVTTSKAELFSMDWYLTDQLTLTAGLR
jgi:hypothetical protein